MNAAINSLRNIEVPAKLTALLRQASEGGPTVEIEAARVQPAPELVQPPAAAAPV